MIDLTNAVNDHLNNIGGSLDQVFSNLYYTDDVTGEVIFQMVINMDEDSTRIKDEIFNLIREKYMIENKFYIPVNFLNFKSFLGRKEIVPYIKNSFNSCSFCVPNNTFFPVFS